MKDQQMFGPLPPVPVPSSTPPEASGGGGSGVTPERDREALDQEKRLRREIANSNERRRMQSINAGFQSLRNLLPHHEGEKLSKVRIIVSVELFKNIICGITTSYRVKVTSSG